MTAQVYPTQSDIFEGCTMEISLQLHKTTFSSLDVKVCEPLGILTKEAVDDAKQATHGADDGRDDIILSLYLQTAGVYLGHACTGPFGAQPSGICHSG